MKKIVLSLMVAGSLLATSCKEAKKEAKDLKDATVEAASKAADATKDGANAVVDGVKDGANAVVDGAKNVAEGASDMVASAFDGISIPKLSNPAVTENLKEYAKYAKEYVDADGNNAKITAMASKGKKLAKEGAKLLPTLSKEEQLQYSKTLSAIMSKMAPAK